MSNDDFYRETFKEEAAELLIELENGLLELEDDPGNNDLINRVFRAMHTIKGSGAMFGFDDIASFTHDVETVFDDVRNGLLPVTSKLLDVSLSAKDYIKWLLEDPAAAYDQRGKEIVSQFHAFREEGTAKDEELNEEPADIPPASITAENIYTYRIRFRPNPNILTFGSNPLSYIEELVENGIPQIFSNVDAIPDLESITEEFCYVWWDLILASPLSPDDIKGVFLFIEDDCDISIELLVRADEFEERSTYKKLGEILIERGDIDVETLKRVLQSQKRLGDLLTEAGLVSPQVVQSALAEQNTLRSASPGRQRDRESDAASSIRVAADKLDKLVDLVGELVIVQSQIRQAATAKRDPLMKGLSEQLDRLSDELRDSTLDIRMLPIGTTFNRFRRLVRDLSAELGKEIELETFGAETELDKTVIERLVDPLVHLLRNSIDHGVEPPEDRKEAGKSSVGHVVLSAEHSGGDVSITIRDDGKGMDPHVLRQKAIAKGLIAADTELSDQECFHLVFMPGFSTAETVTSVSGRGVGMDVVKRSIDGLRGAVEIESTKGEGTAITIRLPLTLAIINGLQTETGGEYYVLPLSDVEECVELEHNEKSIDGRQFINLRGEIVPYIRLRDWFNIAGMAPPIEQIVISNVHGVRTGIVVDHVVGEHQTVIKSLGRLYHDIAGLSGATIQGDGTLALIVDVPNLIRSATSTEHDYARSTT
ncbi:chemotaxis protein CheA [Desulfovibrio inopinatus]|uniref:chemotaxis protein CheA n=1 Tax=Desulfovibrio inopinatus TaxID=102109 RepID=UPI0004281067|nr:chemotaxis protein CheA [Desulfovibrio inopinatus]